MPTVSTKRRILAASALVAILIAGSIFGGGAFETGALAPDVAEATVPPKRCGKIEVRGKKYVVKSHRTKCRFARRWSRKVLKGKEGPRGWSCQRYSRKETRIAFVCRKAGKDFFAIRK